MAGMGAGSGGSSDGGAEGKGGAVVARGRREKRSRGGPNL
jgi:hypothetical protein